MHLIFVILLQVVDWVIEFGVFAEVKFLFLIGEPCYRLIYFLFFILGLQLNLFKGKVIYICTYLIIDFILIYFLSLLITQLFVFLICSLFKRFLLLIMLPLLYRNLAVIFKYLNVFVCITNYLNFVLYHL